MIAMDVKFELITTEDTILKRAQRRAEKDINIKMRNTKKIFEKDFPKILKAEVEKTVEFRMFIQDLALAEKYYGEFGIPDISDRIAKVMEHWYNESRDIDFIPFKFTNNSMVGHLIVRWIKSDYSDVLSLEESKYIIGTLKGIIELDWLEWLLLSGPGYIIHDYFYIENEKTQSASRTNTGIMVHKEGKGWGLPLELSGTADDNFLTRSLASAIDIVTARIFGKIDKLFK